MNDIRLVGVSRTVSRGGMVRGLRQTPLATALLALVLLAPSAATAAEHNLGLGLHYWQSLDDLADEIPGIEDSGVSWLASYIFDVEGPLKLGADLEYFRNGFGGSKGSAWSPQIFAFIGGKWYGGVGMGTTLASSFDGNRSDPYFLARVGVDFAILPHMTIDLNLNYKSDAFNQLDNFETDALTVGVIVRWRLKSKE